MFGFQATDEPNSSLRGHFCFILKHRPAIRPKPGKISMYPPKQLLEVEGSFLLRVVIGMHWLWKHCSIDYLTEELSDGYVIKDQLTEVQPRLPRLSLRFILFCPRLLELSWLRTTSVVRRGE